MLGGTGTFGTFTLGKADTIVETSGLSPITGYMTVNAADSLSGRVLAAQSPASGNVVFYVYGRRLVDGGQPFRVSLIDMTGVWSTITTLLWDPPITSAYKWHRLEFSSSYQWNDAKAYGIFIDNYIPDTSTFEWATTTTTYTGAYAMGLHNAGNSYPGPYPIMMAGIWYADTILPDMTEYRVDPVITGGVHYLLNGKSVSDEFGKREHFFLGWQGLSVEEAEAIDAVFYGNSPMKFEDSGNNWPVVRANHSPWEYDTAGYVAMNIELEETNP